jgi:hypothetical protein
MGNYAILQSSQVIGQISNRLRDCAIADPEKLVTIYNLLFAKKVKYIGSQQFEKIEIPSSES